MQKIVWMCDKCGKDIEEIHVRNVNGIDLCPECYDTFVMMFQQWLDEDPEEKNADNPIESASEDAPESEPELDHEDTQRKKRSRIDWGKACALKRAGWNNAMIADEVGTSKGTIDACIYKEMDKRGMR